MEVIFLRADLPVNLRIDSNLFPFGLVSAVERCPHWQGSDLRLRSEVIETAALACPAINAPMLQRMHFLICRQLLQNFCFCDLLGNNAATQ